jgi:hypothetical protein
LNGFLIFGSQCSWQDFEVGLFGQIINMVKIQLHKICYYKGRFIDICIVSPQEYANVSSFVEHLHSHALEALEKKNPDLVVSGLHSGHVKIRFFRV